MYEWISYFKTKVYYWCKQNSTPTNSTHKTAFIIEMQTSVISYTLTLIIAKSISYEYDANHLNKVYYTIQNTPSSQKKTTNNRINLLSSANIPQTFL